MNEASELVGAIEDAENPAIICSHSVWDMIHSPTEKEMLESLRKHLSGIPIYVVADHICGQWTISGGDIDADPALRTYANSYSPIFL